MNYEMLFLDVDGTLKQEPYGISDDNKQAIHSACKNGKKISIASGRNKNLILDTVKELQLTDYGVSYTIALNGAHIIDNSTGETLHTVEISREMTRLLFEKANELKISSHVYTENHIFFNYQDFQYDWYEKGGCDCRLIDLSRDDLGLTEEPLKFFILSKDHAKLDRFKEEMDAVTNVSLNAEFSSIYSLEYTSVNASKGLGMKYVCGLYGMPLSKAVAAGDGENDISMLSIAGLGVAMKNALESVKAVADTVTERTCKENGVTEIIHKYLLS